MQTWPAGPLLIAALITVAPACRGRTPGVAVSAVAAVESTEPPGKSEPVEAQSADDECVRSRPEPILARAASGSAPTFQSLGPYEAKETAELDGKIALNLRQFGCAHYGVEYSFYIPDAEPKSSPPEAWLKRAAELLRKLSVVPSQQAAVRSIADLLRASAGGSYAYGDPLQMSEMETVSVRVEASPPGTKLQVLYDVAL